MPVGSYRRGTVARATYPQNSSKSACSETPSPSPSPSPCVISTPASSTAIGRECFPYESGNGQVAVSLSNFHLTTIEWPCW